MKHLQAEGFQDVTAISDALKIFFAAVGDVKVKIERVRIQGSVGRILATDVTAGRYLPSADLSVLDGYAVRSEDVQNASQTLPAILSIVGESRLGELCRLKVGPRQAVVVATGSILPEGADSVVMVEQTTREEGGRVAVHVRAPSGHGVSRKGEDIAPGRLVLRKGRRIRPEDIGILKALGVSEVRVVKRLRVGILSTGNELVNFPRKNNPAKIVDVNRPILSAMIRELGGQAVDLGVARDEEPEIMRALRKGIGSTDVILVTAGSSVGKRDLVPNCINRLGKPGMVVHGVAMRPAMPTGLAVVKGKAVVSLPGFPVSAMFAFRVFVLPLLAKLTGLPEPVEPTIRAVLKERIVGVPHYRTFVRVLVERGQTGFLAQPLKVQRASLLMSMVESNGVVTVPEDVEFIEAGREVEVRLTGDV
jgi:molybdopterin molybdotransferase